MSANTTTTKLNTRLFNESMKYVKSIDVKSITNSNAFANVMIDQSVRDQIDLELSQSYKLFKNKVKRFVSNINVNNLDEMFNQYINAIDTTKDSHSQHHVDLMLSNKNTKTKWFNVFMTELITAQLMNNNSYLELNHIAYNTGKVLNNKEYNGDVTIALTLGANIARFFYSLNMITLGSKTTKEKHNVSTIKLGKFITIPEELEQSANSVRANSPMLCKPLEHTPLSEGGQLLNRCVMLNNKQLEHGFEFYRAVNYMNQQPLKLRVDNDIISEWFKTDRFYNDELQELKGEKLKVLNDLALFQDKTFYVTYQADERSRLYSAKSNYLNPQGDMYQKAMFISHQEPLTQTGIDALKISIVNEVYSDKISREEAIAWYDENQDKLQLTTPLSKVYYRDLQAGMLGEDVGSILHQDMTTSGLAIYSLLGRDELGASLTNLIFKGKIADAYGALADALNKEFGITNLNRSTVKKAFMVFLYGSGSNLLLSNDIDDERYTSLIEAIVVTNNLDLELEQVWDKFELAMEAIAPAAIKLMNLIYKFKTKDNHYKWVSRDGFITDIQVKSKTPTEHKGFSLSLDGKTHRHSINVIENLKDNKYDKSLAPHIIHSIDAYILRCIVRECEVRSLPIYTIHDSFGTTPNYYFELNEVVRQVMAKCLEEDLLEDILRQLDAEKLEVAILRGMLPKGQLTKADLLSAVNIVR